MSLQRFIRLTELVKIVGLSERQIYKLLNKSEFPRPVPIGRHSIGWLESEVDDWMKIRIAMRDSGQFTKFTASGRHAIAELCE